jgi:hypothetical protein
MGPIDAALGRRAAPALGRLPERKASVQTLQPCYAYLCPGTCDTVTSWGSGAHGGCMEVMT